MTRFDWSDPSSREPALARPKARGAESVFTQVRQIIEDIRRGGWHSLTDHAIRLDGAAPRCLKVEPFARAASESIPKEALQAMALAARNIALFHRSTVPSDVEISPTPGLRVAKVWRAVETAGLYVPGGKAPLFSTLMMLAIPARTAGVERIVVVTPPRTEGGLDPGIAYAAKLCGIEEIWTVGGAQAIAALAFGAGEIPKVDRVCGPGNRWVSAAKAIVSSLPGGPAIDLPAGPSELMILADDSARPAFVAADLLSQAEHDPDAQVLLVSPSAGLIDLVAGEVTRQSAGLGGDLAPVRYIRCADLHDAIGIANRYAPEHLTLACRNPEQFIAEIRNAGSIFVGDHAAEAFGDYLAGSSHVLPTDGAARFAGGVSTLTFMKALSIQIMDENAAAELAGPAAALARLEGLEAHARAAEARSAA